jgi:hypothetical protein
MSHAKCFSTGLVAQKGGRAMQYPPKTFRSNGNSPTNYLFCRVSRCQLQSHYALLTQAPTAAKPYNQLQEHTIYKTAYKVQHLPDYIAICTVMGGVTTQGLLYRPQSNPCQCICAWSLRRRARSLSGEINGPRFHPSF